jgi:hypothetical protein
MASDNFHIATNARLSLLKIESFTTNEKECKLNDFGIFGITGDNVTKFR